MTPYGEDRGGAITEISEDCWEVECDFCNEKKQRPTYQEASIWLTKHLEDKHSNSEDG